MILAVDIGNTNIVLGGYQNEALVFSTRLATDKTLEADQYALQLEGILRLYHLRPDDVEDAVLSSVVPPMTDTLCRALGTLCGAVASGFLPPSVRSALSIAIYGMFIAIVVPVAKQSRAVLGVVALAVALSCAMHWVPVLNTVSSGFSIILCTVLAAGLGALAAPVPDEPSGAPDGEVA